MRIASYHAHTNFCDGAETPEAMAEAALREGMTDLAFTAHAAWPFATEWHLPLASYPAYAAEIARLKERYAGRLRVLFGFEADFIDGVTAPDPEFYARFAPDILVGSAHFVRGKGSRSRTNRAPQGLWAVDAPAETVARGVETLFEGDGRRAVEAYWSTVRDMISSSRFDVIGHLDVVRRRNGELRFFDEDASWYARETRETVRAIARSGKVVEINTGGIARKSVSTPYPSAEILALLNRAGVPVTISSDAHSSGDIACAYDLARDAARKAGYETLSFRDDSRWVQEKF
jgi:histidinol-phosphatase (PHP family)